MNKTKEPPMSEKVSRIRKIVYKHLLRPKESAVPSEFTYKGYCFMCGYPIGHEVMKKGIEPMIVELTMLAARKSSDAKEG